MPDFSDYHIWMQKVENAEQSKALARYLSQNGVDNVMPIHQLLRSDEKWKICKAPPFIVPPKSDWPNMVPTLKLIRDHVVPVTGPIEALSVYRSPSINNCIKGASRSYHLRFYAIDMQPVKPMARDELVRILCKLHRSKGKTYSIGLGIYSGSRFHIDSAGYRTWGKDFKLSSSPCLK